MFSLGDAGSSPNSKTAAAVRKQAPVVVANLLSAMDGKPLTASHDGYASCPLTTGEAEDTARRVRLLDDVDPDDPSDQHGRGRTDMGYLKRYGLPFLYWNLMLIGRA